MRLAAEPAGPVQAAIIQRAVEAVQSQPFRNETSQTFHSGLLGSLCHAGEKGIPLVCRRAGSAYSAALSVVVAPRGRVGARPPHCSASGSEKPEGWLPRIKVAGRPTHGSRSPGALSTATDAAKSPLASRRSPAGL